jgi:hypothetical protein
MDEHSRITESIELLELARTAQAADELLDVHQIARKRAARRIGQSKSTLRVLKTRACCSAAWRKRNRRWCFWLGNSIGASW